MANTLNALTTGGGGLATSADSSGAITFQKDGTATATIDANGNVGIGTSSPVGQLNLYKGAGVANYLDISGNGQTLGTASVAYGQDTLNVGYFWNRGNAGVVIGTNNSERMRIDSSGNVLISRTDTSSTTRGTYFEGGGIGAWNCYQPNGGSSAVFKATSSGNQIGSITHTTTNTAFNTSSDYRLKENIAPMIGALETIAQLKPSTYTWKATGEASQGFIAHELQAVVPDCVTGEKDAVDAEGTPVYQGVDTSFLVATLTAAIQEQQELIKQLQADVAALKGVA